MPQKPLKVKKTSLKKAAANRHGKAPLTKKGNYSKPPKKAALLKKHNEEKEVTKMINAHNEGTTAGVAAKSGGKLGVVKPPVLAPANQKGAKKKGKADAAAPMEA